MYLYVHPCACRSHVCVRMLANGWEAVSRNLPWPSFASDWYNVVWDALVLTASALGTSGVSDWHCLPIGTLPVCGLQLEVQCASTDTIAWPGLSDCCIFRAVLHQLKRQNGVFAVSETASFTRLSQHWEGQECMGCRSRGLCHEKWIWGGKRKGGWSTFLVCPHFSPLPPKWHNFLYFTGFCFGIECILFWLDLKVSLLHQVSNHNSYQKDKTEGWWQFLHFIWNPVLSTREEHGEAYKFSPMHFHEKWTWV